MEYEHNDFVSETDTKTQISKIPINVLFDPEGIKKKNVWDIDLVQILSLLLEILEKADRRILELQGWQHYHHH